MTRLANSLVTFRSQIDARFPNRNKASDGWIASAGHLNRTGAGAAASQHNPNVHDVVCAVDITEDLSVGLDCNRLMEELDASNDRRIFYIIHDYQIDNSDDRRTPYHGSNPHTRHLHLSSWWQYPNVYDDGSPWNIPMLGGGGPAPAPGPDPRRGSSLPYVRSRPLSFQRWYNAYDFRPALLPIIRPLANNFGPQSLAALKKVQARYGLVPDGIDGPLTKALLWDLGWRG